MLYNDQLKYQRCDIVYDIRMHTSKFVSLSNSDKSSEYSILLHSYHRVRNRYCKDLFEEEYYVINKYYYV